MTDLMTRPATVRRDFGEADGADHRRRRHLSAVSDDILLEAARTGDPDAFAELYRRHHRDALRYAGHLTRRSMGSDAADDIVAEAVRKVLTAIRGGRGPMTGFRPYLFTVIRTVAVSASARHGGAMADGAHIPETSLPGPEDDVTSSLARDALSSLPRRWQQVLWATSVTDVGHDELAARWGVSARAIASVAMRARAALRIAFVRSQLPHATSRSCDAALDQLALLVVGTLEAPNQKRLEQHLGACASCHRARTSIDAEFTSWPARPGSSRIVAPNH